ncbi:hypothetical protein L914_07793, partial [Phytophthora nicotianae]
SQSRRPDSIPPFLHLVAAELSNDALAKISWQWDLFMVNKSESKCIRVGPTQSEWKVFLSGQESCVDDLMWSYSRLFYKSRRLPCQHVMVVACKAHLFKVLPTTTVPSQWSMRKTEELYDSLGERPGAASTSYQHGESPVKSSNGASSCRTISNCLCRYISYWQSLFEVRTSPERGTVKHGRAV